MCVELYFWALNFDEKLILYEIMCTVDGEFFMTTTLNFISNPGKCIKQKK